jgi:hypothetical protein
MHAAHNACPQSLRITVRVASLAASAQRWQRTSPEVVMLLFEDGNTFVFVVDDDVVVAGGVGGGNVLSRSLAGGVRELLIRVNSDLNENLKI